MVIMLSGVWETFGTVLSTLLPKLAMSKLTAKLTAKSLAKVTAKPMGGKYNDLVYTGMSIYQYIPVYTPGSYLLDLPIRFQ